MFAVGDKVKIRENSKRYEGGIGEIMADKIKGHRYLVRRDADPESHAHRESWMMAGELEPIEK